MSFFRLDPNYGQKSCGNTNKMLPLTQDWQNPECMQNNLLKQAESFKCKRYFEIPWGLQQQLAKTTKQFQATSLSLKPKTKKTYGILIELTFTDSYNNSVVHWIKLLFLLPSRLVGNWRNNKIRELLDMYKTERYSTVVKP